MNNMIISNLRPQICGLFLVELSFAYSNVFDTPLTIIWLFMYITWLNITN